MSSITETRDHSLLSDITRTVFHKFDIGLAP